MIRSNDILANIRRLLRSINIESKRIEKAHGVSIPQLLCLSHLRSLPDARSTIKEIAAALTLNASTASGIVKRLEAKGYVARLPNRKDRRGSLIALTEKGAGLVDASPIPLHAKLDAKLDQLSGSELQMIDRGLRRLIELLELEAVDASPIVVIEEELAPGRKEEE